MRPTVCKAYPGRPSRLFGLLAAFGLAFGAGGCSFALPVFSARATAEAEEPQSTGSLGPEAPPRLAPELGPEDWRRASAALAVALDPQGNGKPVRWDNPETELRGTIEAAGPPFVRDDAICRPFRAMLSGPALAREVRGTACRLSGAPWEIARRRPERRHG